MTSEPITRKGHALKVTFVSPTDANLEPRIRIRSLYYNGDSVVIPFDQRNAYTVENVYAWFADRDVNVIAHAEMSGNAYVFLIEPFRPIKTIATQFTDRITYMERLRNTTDGNPRLRVVTENHGWFNTHPNSAYVSDLLNLRDGNTAIFALDSQGRIDYVLKVDAQ